MSSAKMLTQLITSSNSDNKEKNTNGNSGTIFNRDINAMIDKYENLRGQDRKNWINIQKDYLSTHHPFYSLYSKPPDNPPPGSKEFMEQAWDNYQYRFE